MSYELFLHPRGVGPVEAAEWFRRRPGYSDIVTGGAAYRNDDTAVEFSFAVTEDEPDVPRHIWFRVPVERPHTFALEAEPELSAFIAKFDCRVRASEEPDAWIEYSGAGFASGWNTANRAAFAASGEEAKAADPEVVEAAWRWNIGRAALQKAAGHKVFVPKIVWISPSHGDDPVATVTWTQGMSVVIPEELVTHLVLVRQKPPSLMKMFGFSRSKPGEPEYEFKLAGMTSGLKLRGVERSQAEGFAVAITPANETLEIQAMFAGPWEPSQFRIVPAEQVCGADLVALRRTT